MTGGGPGPAPRLASVDGARGLAVLGLGLCNAPGLILPLPCVQDVPRLASPGDRWLWLAEQVLLQGRLVALLSLLFGASMVWVGGDGSDPRKRACLDRRLAWLAVIGAAHGALLWWGDILLPYAIAGLILRPCRGWPPRRLAILGLVAYAAGVNLLRVDAAAALWRDAAPALPPAVGACDTPGAMDWLSALPSTLAATLMTSAPLMLLGMAMARGGWLSDAALRRRAGAWLAAGAGAALAVLPLALARAGLWAPTDVSPAALAFWAITLRLATAPAGALGWLAVAHLSRHRWGRLAAAGRMALSLYLGQSVLARCGVMLAPSALRGMSYTQLMLASAVVLAGLALAAGWGRHRGWQGPAETAWRKLYQQADKPSTRRRSL